MMTQFEARQRLTLNRMSLNRTPSGDFRVAFADRRDEASDYYTDDLEDAVLTGAAMRRRASISAQKAR